MHKLPVQPQSGGLTKSDKVEFRLPIYVESDLIRDFPAQIAREFGVVPLGRIGKKGSLLLASKEELSTKALKDLRERLGYPFHVIQSSPSEVKEAVSKSIRRRHCSTPMMNRRVVRWRTGNQKEACSRPS